MGIRVEDLLKLPSLRNVEVVSGKRNLQKIVSSISVLEISEMSVFNDILQPDPEEYFGGEIVISSFFSIKDDIDKQCHAVRTLYNLGEIGVILYYVGIIVPKLDQRVIELAEELGFLIICMPKDNSGLRYSEVIMDVTEAIVKSQNSSANLVKESIEKISLLPTHLRTVEMTLKLLADRIKSTIILTDSSYNIINKVRWPRTSTLDIDNILSIYTTNFEENKRKIETLEIDEHLYSIGFRKIKQNDFLDLKLFIIHEGKDIKYESVKQASEVVQVASNLWGEKHGDISKYELVNAIINDESEKMRRIASIMNINITDINTMWIIKISDISKTNKIKNELEVFLSMYYDVWLVEFINNYIVVLLGNSYHKGNESEISEIYAQTSTNKSSIDYLVFCPRMMNTTDVRKTFLLINSLSDTLKKVYKNKLIFMLSEINLISKAFDLVKHGEESIQRSIYPIEPILNNGEMIKTLTTFLLDSNANYERCGEILYVHKNTVKYRIKKISSTIGYDVTKLSETFDVFLAIIVFRIIN